MVLLLACGPHLDTGRDLAIVPDDGEGDGPTPFETATGDTAAEPWAPGLGCGDGDPADDPTGEDVLVVEACARVTPEAEFGDTWEGETGPVDDTGGDTGGDTGTIEYGPPPPPCGFVNLVGSVAGASSIVLYCDADADGGTRAVRYDPAQGVVSMLVLPGDCTAEPATGALVPEGEGWRAIWSSAVASPDVPPGLVGLRLDAQGRPDGDIEAVADGLDTWKLAVLQAEPRRLLANDQAGDLWIVDDQGDTTPVATGVRSFAAVAEGAGGWVATCDTEGELALAPIDGAALGPATPVSGTACAWPTTPSLAADGEGFALAWDDGMEGFVAFFDGEGAERARVALGEDAFFPTVAWDGERYLSVDALGAVHAYDAVGNVLDTWWHPGVVDAPGEVAGLRLEVGADQWRVLLIGLDSYRISEQHVNSFNYVEESVVVARR